MSIRRYFVKSVFLVCITQSIFYFNYIYMKYIYTAATRIYIYSITDIVQLFNINLVNSCNVVSGLERLSRGDTEEKTKKMASGALWLLSDQGQKEAATLSRPAGKLFIQFHIIYASRSPIQVSRSPKPAIYWGLPTPAF